MKKVFVISQQYIKSGLILLDEVIFKDQRFFHRICRNRVNLFQDCWKLVNKISSITRCTEVLFDSLLEIARFADINHVVVAVLHQIHAGGRWQLDETLFNIEVSHD